MYVGGREGVRVRVVRVRVRVVRVRVRVVRLGLVS